MGLFRPAWKSKNEYKAEKAVKKITNQKKLARIAIEAGSWTVRKVAVKKLTDQTVLAEVAIIDSDSGVRRAAVENLTDQTLLAEIAIKDSNDYVRRAAVWNLTDQTVLAKVARLDRNSTVRLAAVEKLTDQKLLVKIAIEDKDDYVSKAAVEKLPDQKVLKDIAEILFTEIMKTDNDKLDYNVQNKISALISIAKRYPQLIRENWGQASNKISRLHADRQILHRDVRGGNCHEDRSHDDFNAASRYGLVFPRYPFND
jgi:hypothetical protein